MADDAGGVDGRGGPDPVTRAAAMFAASAVTRLARALREAGVIDDFLIGELAAVAQECAAEVGGEAKQAMEIVRAELGAPSRGELERQAAADAAEAAEDSA